MRILPLVTGLALLLLPVSTSVAYEWYHVPIDTTDHPTYEIRFDGETGYAGTEVGVFRGYGPAGWQGMGLEYPGLGAYSILNLEGSGWVKHPVNQLLLGGATGVAVGDLDHSGYADIVVTAMDPGHCVVWYENPLPETVSPFWNRWEVESPVAGAREVAIGDLNGDGHRDLAVAIRDESEIVWYENVPFSQPISWIRHHVGFLGGPRGVFIADINDDDRPDIVAGGMDVNTVMWYEAPPIPGGLWAGYCVDDSLEGVKGVFAYDVDGDGDLDIVAAGRDADHVVWYEQGAPGDPMSWTKHFIDDDIDGPVNVWCGDLVGDGMAEVAVTAKEAGWVVVYLPPDEVGGMWTRVVIDSNLEEACPISAGDLDGDGRTDIVAAGRAAGVVAWYKARGESGLSWQKHVIDDAAGGSMGITTGDLDNDGDVDVVATARIEGTVTWYENDLGDLYCAYSEGSGQCESDGIYHWRDESQEWVASWWCARPFFIEEHPLVPDLFFCGNHDGLFASDNMTDWFELGSWILPDTVRCIWFHPSDTNILMVGTDRGLYRTTDAGMHWGLAVDVPELPVRDIESMWPQAGPSNTPFVYLVEGMGTFSDGLYRSDDLGASWMRLSTIFLPTDLLQDYTADGHGVFLFIGTMMDGIYRAREDGTITGTLNTGLPSRTIHRMRYDPYIYTLAIFACTEGGLYECMLLEVTATAPEPRVAGIRCDAWPNPWREGVAFSFDGLDGEVPVTLSVYNLLGRRVWTSEGRATSGGTWTVRWSGKLAGGCEPAPGMYFYRAEAGARVYSGKIVRVR
ncbi:MAG: T9SS type A sorting domain-containing protein [Candidatus Eisenbacteria sp.]|nr:T9SS type A sorting domain-containing protein [Candidatus Eisenbacteria bacterium]